MRPLSAYVAIGTRLINFAVDIPGGRLDRRGEAVLPSRIQYVAAHPTLPLLYVACADRGPGAGGDPFYLCTMARDEAGDLHAVGERVPLPARPIHLTVDPAGTHVLTASSQPAGLTVHPLHGDGSIGTALPPAQSLDVGSAPHQVRVTPCGTRAIVMARGKKGFGTAAYKTGSLVPVRFDRGRVESLEPIIPKLPRGFNPRTCDFHPHKPLLYVSLEAQNELCVFEMDGAEIAAQPEFVGTTLAEPDNVQPRQDCGSVRVHPSGRFAYVANRNDGYVGGLEGPSWLTPDPVPVFPGGENSIAVFALDEQDRHTLIQVENSCGLHPRTFALDPSGRLLIVGHIAPTVLEIAGALHEVPANLALFAIGDDGQLTFLRCHDLELGGEMIWWTGLVD